MEIVDHIVHGDYLIPVDEKHTVIEDGAVAVCRDGAYEGDGR
jgi:hypothetical protein